MLVSPLSSSPLTAAATAIANDTIDAAEIFIFAIRKSVLAGDGLLLDMRWSICLIYDLSVASARTELFG